MGLFSRKYKNPARGTATVASATACPSHASSASCRMNLVIALPGMPATPTQLTAMVRADKWPFPGATLPVEIDLDKPSRMRILWDEVPSGRERGAAAAQQIAAQLNAASAGAPPPMTAPTVVQPTPGAPVPSGLQVGGEIGPDAAAALSAAFGGVTIPPGARVVSTSTTINGQPAGPDQIAAIESLTGMDLNGDGVIGKPPTQ